MRRGAGRLLTVLGAAAILIATCTPIPEQTARSIATEWWCLLCGELGGVDVLQNLLLFLPFGVGLGLSGVGWRRAAVICACFSLGVELLQLRVVSGRDTSLSDFLTNSIGGTVGAALGARPRLFLLPSRMAARRLAMLWAIGVAAVLAATIQTLQPYTVDVGPYFTLLAHKFSARGHFGGRILEARLNERLLREEEIADFEPIRAEIGGAEYALTARVTTGAPPSRSAPILQVIGPANLLLAELSQHDDRLVFQPPLQARRLRLRRPAVILQDAIQQGTDTLRIWGGRERGHLVIGRAGPGDVREVRYPLTPHLGWQPIAGFVLSPDGIAPWLTALWMLGLYVPLAYWLAMGFGAGAAAAGVGLLAALGAWAGVQTDLAALPWSEWMVLLAALLLGLAGRWAARRYSTIAAIT